MASPIMKRRLYSTAQRGNIKNGSKALRLMPLGGSITYGVGSPDGNGYRKMLYDMLAAQSNAIEMVGSRKSGSMANNDNEGWSGRRIEQIQNKAKTSISKCLPNLITLNVGSNDCLQDFQLESAGARIDALVEDIWSLASPGATVILSTLVMAADEGVNQRVLGVNEQIRELVKRKLVSRKSIVLADMYSLRGPGLGDLGDDGIHPNATGYRKMAAIWAESIGQA